MKWFFKWLRDGINNIDRDDRDTMERDAINKIGIGLAIPKVRNRGLANTISTDREISLNQQPMHFKIYPATGGHIVEYLYYNEKNDKHDQALHLIPSELDLGAELAKIMTLEALKR